MPAENKKIESSKIDSGLTTAQVLANQKQYGLNIIHSRKINIFSILIRQITGNPLTIILAFATFVSYLLGQHVSSYYIFGIILISISLGLWNEYSAEKTIDNLLKKISSSALVIRNGEKQEITVNQVTIGDIVLLSQGSIIPADLKLLETNRLEVNESSLTGEAKTVYKKVSESAFMGTSVDSGSASGVVIAIGKNTEFGKIAKSATFIKPVTEFQTGLVKFGQFIVKTIVVLTVSIFAVNALLGHNILESALFALAIAVGLTPELLPVIVTVSLSHGAGKLAKKHVVVKKLLSLENLGNMDILCTDKTGTLTEGQIEVVDYINSSEKKDEAVLKLALLSDTAVVHHKVIGNSIDVALWEHATKNKINLDSCKKIHEEAFDYNKKIGFTVVKNGKEIELIAKGSPESILALCKSIKNKEKLHSKLLEFRKDGLRLIAVATKSIAEKEKYSWTDVEDLEFQGLITFLDIPRKTAGLAMQELRNLNVTTKVITGDNEIITKKICSEVGMDVKKTITGQEIAKLSDAEFKKIVVDIDIFAQVTPLQKLQIIKSLQDNGHTVGYLGDGINDLPALHNADIGISVNSAVDVAKDAASVVLLRKNLEVIHDGIREGRKTFNNTIK
ncbi:MAG TPA: HAD-IC family P-type ATPase, partial [Candidatus Saccharimonadales bacterium]|nr:HAD-IC family P-type ATPase [Candidatus Saccharimonadales bacterium]